MDLLKLVRAKYTFKYELIRRLSSNSSTIFALSSGQGKCGVAVIRVSGAACKEVLTTVTGLSTPPVARMALLRSIKHPLTNDVLDKGLVLWFPGEDCCELHVHGGRAVISAVFDALGALPKLRLAEPGEFTRRAFYNGKLNLTEVEGLSDLLQAETEAQRKQAFLQTQGALSNLYSKWRQTLLQSLAYIEAHIDFEETEVLDDGLLKEVTDKIEKLRKEIKEHINSGRKGETLRSGAKTVIIGEPNVGKSSLLNIMCQRPAAIVTPIEGTTRDILEVTLNIGGYPMVLIDTAGLRNSTDDIIEKEGISRTLNIYEIADLIILVIDSSQFDQFININPNNGENINKFDSLFEKNCLVVVNKIDLSTAVELPNEVVCISCKSEEGINDLVDRIVEKLKILCGNPSEEHPSMNQARHREHLSNCLKNIEIFLNNNNTNDVVLLAEYLRQALRQIGKLIGSITTEELLDVIFKDFCIGK